MTGRTVWSLDDYLGVVEPYLPAALVSAESFSGLRALAAHLLPASMVGFECSLAGDTQDADLAVALPAGSPDIHRLAGHGPDNPLLEALLAGSAWQRISALCAQASEPSSMLHGRIGTVWLEFDTQRQRSGIPLPNVLFGLPFDGRAGSVDPCQVAESALEILRGEPLPRGVRDMLGKCFTACPPGAHLFQLGVMLGRRAAGVRVCLVNLSFEDIREYLGRLGWTGPGEELMRALSPLTGLAVRIGLGIDVAETILPRFGIECYPHRGNRTRVEGHWAELLDLLVARDMCHPDKGDALLQWPGQAPVRLLWPMTVARGLNHIKLVYQPGHEVGVKAYFGFVCVT